MVLIDHVICFVEYPSSLCSFLYFSGAYSDSFSFFDSILDYSWLMRILSSFLFSPYHLLNLSVQLLMKGWQLKLFVVDFNLPSQGDWVSLSGWQCPSPLWGSLPLNLPTYLRTSSNENSVIWESVPSLGISFSTLLSSEPIKVCLLPTPGPLGV